MNNEKIVGLIPARLGSVRVRAKSLRILGGNPLIYYIIDAVKKSSKIQDAYVNSDSVLFRQIADRYGVDFYHRDQRLATSDSLIDDYIYDFCTKVSSDILVVANPTSPFLEANDIDKAIENFIANGYDTQLACENIRTHSFLDGDPINFSINGKHPRSQDLAPVQALNFAVTIWRTQSFINSYEQNGYGVYSGKIGFFALKGLSTIDIDWEEDFQLAEHVLTHLNNGIKSEPKYDQVLDDMTRSGTDTRT